MASRTTMIGCKGDMIDFWFGFLRTTEQYEWWHPKDHVWCEWVGERGARGGDRRRGAPSGRLKSPPLGGRLSSGELARMVVIDLIEGSPLLCPMRLSDRIISKIKLNVQSILRTDANAATLFAGLTYSLTRELAMNFSVGVGIAKDAPDFQLEMRLPFRLPYRGPSLEKFAFWRDSPSEANIAVKKGRETATAY